MKENIVEFWFGVSSEPYGPRECPAAYPRSIKFEVGVEGAPRTWEEAVEVLNENREDFLRMLERENISCAWQELGEDSEWIPDMFLEYPEHIKVKDLFSFVHPCNLL